MTGWGPALAATAGAVAVAILLGVSGGYGSSEETPSLVVPPGLA